MKFNRLSLNYIKPSYFVYGPKGNSTSLENFYIKVGMHDIPPADTVKHLGVVMDKHLNWKAHINHIKTKLSYAAKFLSQIRNYMNKQTLIKLYYSFAYPHLKYAIILRGSACKSSLEKFQVIAKQYYSNYEF